MTDPVQTTQQTSAVVDSAGGPGGVMGAILGALTVLGGLWRIVFGTRAERDAAALAQDAQEQTQAEHAADIALRAADRADEDTRRVRAQLGTCEERLAAMGVRLDGMETRLRAAERDHAPCASRIAHLEREQERAREMLALLMGSTPDLRFTGNDVRAAMAQEDDDG